MRSRIMTFPVNAGLLAVTGMATLLIWWLSHSSAEQSEAKARAALAQRDFAAAVDFLEATVRQSPRRVSAWKMLADAACHAGQASRSSSALEEAVRLAPAEMHSLCLQLGGRWMANNRIRPAIHAFQLAIVADPRPPQPYRLLAQIYAVVGHRREIVRNLMELVKRKEFTRNDLIVLTSVNPSIDDPTRLQQLLTADPADKTPLLSLAMQELDKNRVDSARDHLHAIVAAEPENAEAQGILGELYADFEPEQFVRWNAQLPSSLRDDARVWLARGKWLQTTGQTVAAIRCLQESYLREPENLAAVTLLGQLLKAEGETELGQAFTERGRRLQRIIDLSERIKEPRGEEAVVAMIEELEATGRLWEAWGWCLIVSRGIHHRKDVVDPLFQRIEPQLRSDLPRTTEAVRIGARFDWGRFPLPNWSELNSNAPQPSPSFSEEPSRMGFKDISDQVQLDFRYINTRTQESGHKIFETMGAGVAVIDYDRDGWPDLYFPQGKHSFEDTADQPSDALFRNVTGRHFATVTASAGIAEHGYSQGVAAGDFDNDGFPDLYVANLGRNCLYHNNGDGTFSDATDSAGLQQDEWTVSCAIADLNGDGLPELFDVNYVRGKELLTATCYDAQRRPVVCRPTVFDAALDTAVLNLGDGRFQEMQGEAGLDLPHGMGLGLVVADFNEDDRLDVFIANDMTANFLLINDGAETTRPLYFRDEAFLRGVALDLTGLAQACMGIACANVNRDRVPDLFVTNFARESATLYLSQPGGLFLDQTQAAGLRTPTFEPLGFGTQFLDADHDGWLDLIVMNGHIDEFVGEPFRMPAQLFRGNSSGKFEQQTGRQAGSLFDVPRLARGLARLDWNRDGWTDFVATDLETRPILAENQSDTPYHSCRLALSGTLSSRDAIGAKVRVQLASGVPYEMQLTAGDGYESSNERVLEIGARTETSIDLIEIQWPSGMASRFRNVACDRRWLAVEGRPELIGFEPSTD